MAARGLELLASRPRPEAFVNPVNTPNSGFQNSDLAFRGDIAFVGNYRGFMIYDISDPANPRLRTSVLCPGGQGDVSIHGDLLFFSVENPARVDCGTQPLLRPASPERFLGVRIYDVSDLDNPRQVAAVQTCRGSHTHTLVPDPNDAGTIYVYVSGVRAARPAEELPGCLLPRGVEDPDPPYFRIEVIRVPLAAPQEARVIATPRVMADRETGEIDGLWKGGDHGPGTQTSVRTAQCHDITVYPEIGLAAGACYGNGILLDISNPADPVRIHEVVDPNFAVWHSATFSNDGSKVVFSDEFGFGWQPKCRATDRPEWGANAIFEIVDRKLEFRGYYKLPAPQTEQENCTAHDGSLIPVPGRDIKIQGWFQGGVSVMDFTDAANPFEIAYFDRGPIDSTQLVNGGYWSTYWYNGHVYATEMARGFDVFRLTPTEHLSQNEIDAANLVRFEQLNVQTQPRYIWPPSLVVARAYLDQLARNDGLAQPRRAVIAAQLQRIEGMGAGAGRQSELMQLATQLEADAATARDANRVRALAAALHDLASGQR